MRLRATLEKENYIKAQGEGVGWLWGYLQPFLLLRMGRGAAPLTMCPGAPASRSLPHWCSVFQNLCRCLHAQGAGASMHATCILWIICVGG